MRTATFSRSAGSSKNNSDWAMCALYIPSAYQSLTLFAIADLRSGATAYSFQCARYRDMATVATHRRYSSRSRSRRGDDVGEATNRRSGSGPLCCVQRCDGGALRPRPSAALLRSSVSSCCLPTSAPGPTRVAAAMATPKRSATSLRSGLLGDAPGRAGRRSCHRARGTRTPCRCAPGSAPLGQRLRQRQRDSTCSVGRPPQRPRPLPRGGRSPPQPRSALECRRREVRGRRCSKAPSAPWFS